VETVERSWIDRRHAAKLERMKASYLIEPANRFERWRHKRAERWLVYNSLGLLASSLLDTRKDADAMRRRWREWRAQELAHRR
jgi:hypothetical protein